LSFVFLFVFLSFLFLFFFFREHFLTHQTLRETKTMSAADTATAAAPVATNTFADKYPSLQALLTSREIEATLSSKTTRCDQVITSSLIEPTRQNPPPNAVCVEVRMRNTYTFSRSEAEVKLIADAGALNEVRADFTFRFVGRNFLNFWIDGAGRKRAALYVRHRGDLVSAELLQEDGSKTWDQIINDAAAEFRENAKNKNKKPVAAAAGEKKKPVAAASENVKPLAAAVAVVENKKPLAASVVAAAIAKK
jgi:hypothetical protein